jgi:HSP20 family molecular chaperone IbpA
MTTFTIKSGIFFACITFGCVGELMSKSNEGSIMSAIIDKPFNQLEKSDLAIDMYQDSGNVVVAMDMPGINSDDIRVEIEDGQLHIFGQRKDKKEVNEKDYYHKEVVYGSFDRLISLPTEIDASGMSYTITDGILTVTIPKA